MSTTAENILAKIAQPSDRDRAAAAWLEAKRDEDAAKERRLAAEVDIVRLFGTKDEGSQTIKTPFFAVETAGNISRKIIDAEYEKIKKQLPRSVRNECVKTTYEPRVGAVKELKKNNPEAYAILARALDVKPAKTSVSVSIIP